MEPFGDAKIESIFLKNIKSYKQGEFTFQDGITVISGENGSGKSTVFEALGFCLFGVPPKDFIGSVENFIRFGHSTGKVIIQYTGIDGESYQVQQAMRGNAAVSKLTPTGWFPLSVANVREFICRTLGLRTSITLDKQFTEIIGPFQAEFVAPFMLIGQKRQDRFDEILGISRWRKLYNNTCHLKTVFTNKINEMDYKIELKKQQIEDLPQLETRQAENENERKNLLQEIEVLKKDLQKCYDQVAEMEERQRIIQLLQTDLSTLAVKKSQVEQRLGERKKELEKSLESEKIIKNCESGFLEYEKDQKHYQDLEKKRKQRDDLREQKNKKSQKFISEKAKLDTRKKNNLQKKDEVLRELENLLEQLVETKKAGKEAEEQVLSTKEVLDEVRKVLEKFQSIDYRIIHRSIEAIEKNLLRIGNLQKESDNKKIELEKMPAVRDEAEKLAGIEEKIDFIKDIISSRHQEIEEKKEGRELLIKGICPYFGEICRNLGDKDPATFFDEKIDELQKEIKILEKDLKNLNKEQKSAREADKKLAALMEVEKSCRADLQKLDDIKKEIKNTILLSEIYEIYNNIASVLGKCPDGSCVEALMQLDETVKRFSFPEEVENYPPILKKLAKAFDKAGGFILNVIKNLILLREGDHLEKSRNRSAIDAQIKELEKQQKSKETEMAKIQEEFGQIEKEQKSLDKMELQLQEMEEGLKKFENLDELMVNVSERLEKNREAYTLYNQHLKTFKNIPELRKTIAGLEGEIQTLIDEISMKKEQMENLQKLFSEESLKEFREMEKNLMAKKEKLSEKMDWLQKEIEKTREQIKEKHAIKAEVEKLTTEKAQWESSRDFASFLREHVFKQVAPRVSRILREEISETANEIYQQICGWHRLGTGEKKQSSREELYWDENYSIKLIDMVEGKRRERVDRQLSGGQFMSAVIALRLALLQTIGSPFAFFDEPTSNLDEDRRKNLAEALRTLNLHERRWYRQIFLVSHDVSFMDVSRNVIELELSADKTTRILTQGLKGMERMRHVRVEA